MLLRFETIARQRRLVLRIEAKFRTFWPPVKIRGGGRFVKCFRLTFWRHLGPNHWYTFDGAPLRRLAAISVRCKKSSEVKYKSDRLTSFGLNNGNGPVGHCFRFKRRYAYVTSDLQHATNDYRHRSTVCWCVGRNKSGGMDGRSANANTARWTDCTCCNGRRSCRRRRGRVENFRGYRQN